MRNILVLRGIYIYKAILLYSYYCGSTTWYCAIRYYQ